MATSVTRHIDFCLGVVIIQDVHPLNKWSACDLKDALKCELRQISHGMIYASKLSTSCHTDIWQKTHGKNVIRIIFLLSYLSILIIFVILTALLCTNLKLCCRSRFNAIYDIPLCQPLSKRKSEGFIKNLWKFCCCNRNQESSLLLCNTLSFVCLAIFNFIFSIPVDSYTIRTRFRYCTATS